MYERPILTFVGEAKDVVLGLAAYGSDLDGSWMIPDMEFLDDEAPLESPVR